MRRTCAHCGKRLPYDATWRRKYCDASCRVAYHRASEVQPLYSEAVRAITALGNVSADEHKKAITTLKDLKKMIDAELRRLGDKDTLEKYQMFGDYSNRRSGS